MLGKIIVKNNSIIFKKQNKNNEADVVNEVRDFAEALFEHELTNGMKVIFTSWNVKQGIVNYKLQG